jgi:hypothetical protein
MPPLDLMLFAIFKIFPKRSFGLSFFGDVDGRFLLFVNDVFGVFVGLVVARFLLGRTGLFVSIVVGGVATFDGVVRLSGSDLIFLGIFYEMETNSEERRC